MAPGVYRATGLYVDVGSFVMISAPWRDIEWKWEEFVIEAVVVADLTPTSGPDWYPPVKKIEQFPEDLDLSVFFGSSVDISVIRTDVVDNREATPPAFPLDCGLIIRKNSRELTVAADQANPGQVLIALDNREFILSHIKTTVEREPRIMDFN